MVRHWKGPEVVKSIPCVTRLERSRIVFSPASQSLYVLSPAGEVQVQDANTLKVKRTFKISDASPLIYHVSPDDRWLVGRSARSGNLSVWDTASGEVVASIKGFESGSNSRDLAVFSPDSALLAVATNQWEVKLWDTANWQIVQTLGPFLWRNYGISFSHDGRHVAGSSWGGEVRIFEAATGREAVAPLHGHGSGVHGHCFSPDDTTLVSVGDDSTVRFWNVATGREMLVFPNAYNQLARLPILSPTGELMVWGDFTQNLQVRVEGIPTLAEIEKAHAAESTAQ
jgi:WD40 repeat protein